MTARRSHLLFAAAVLVALAAAHLLRDTRGFVVRQPDGSYLGDITHYVYWTRLVTLEGVQSAYRGTWPETYAVYPPVTLYGYQAIGNVYRWLEDPTFDVERAQQSLVLLQLVKAAALAWHLLATAAIYLAVRRGAGARLASLAGGLYVANPAALYDVAHWGQPDGAHSAFSVLAVGLVGLGAPLLGWGAMALAALSKPQAWALLPLLVLATWRARGAGGVLRGLLAAGGLSGVVLLPFLAAGTLGQFLSLPGTIATVMPAVTADAHNVWWLVLRARGIEPLFSNDAARLVGPFSYRAVAAGLVGLQFVFSYWLYWTARVRLAEAAALGALGWFLFTTQAHENHLFFALPLLAIAWPARPRLLVPFAVLTVTVLLNMALHDEVLLEGLGLDQGGSLVAVLRTANAVVNLACFAAWCAVAALRRPALAGWSSHD